MTLLSTLRRALGRDRPVIVPPAPSGWPFGELAPFSFDLVMIDPPWTFETWSDKGQMKGPGAHYACMSLDAIKALPVGHLGAQDCVFWLWATHPLHREAFDVLDAWGIRYVTGGTWVKRTRHGRLSFGTGYRLRNSSEPFLIGTNGNPRTARNVRSVIEAEAREHSRKPDAAFAEAERLMAPTRHARLAELFSRESRPGWSGWGHEAGKFDAGKDAA